MVVSGNQVDCQAQKTVQEGGEGDETLGIWLRQGLYEQAHLSTLRNCILTTYGFQCMNYVSQTYLEENTQLKIYVWEDIKENAGKCL